VLRLRIRTTRRASSLLRRLLRWLTGDDLPLGCLAGASMQGTRQGYSDRSRWRSETFHEKTTGSHPHIRKVNLDARRPYIGTSVSIRQSTSRSTSTPDSSCFQLAVLANRCTAQHPPSLLPLNVMKYTEALHGVTSPFRSWALHLYSILNMVFQCIILCRFDGSASLSYTAHTRDRSRSRSAAIANDRVASTQACALAPIAGNRNHSTEDTYVTLRLTAE
jgi:hypothetical protein